uniref:Uncharacterized protein n=1 Tax=Hyaloperonospora arabidopsidis (strain Emoy2) TaxID=559515 RepID=M4BAR7_HYAAE
MLYRTYMLDVAFILNSVNTIPETPVALRNEGPHQSWTRKLLTPRSDDRHFGCRNRRLKTITSDDIVKKKLLGAYL